MLKRVAGSNNVRGRKKRKKARNQAVRNAATAVHANRRRPRLISLCSGPTEATPPAAAALEVPTAGVPTYLVDSPPRATEAAADAAAAAGRAAGAAGLATTAIATAAAACGGGPPSSAVTSASVSA